MQIHRYSVYLTVVMLSQVTFGQQSFVQALTSQQIIQSGKTSFAQNCIGCHGINADGKGEAAKMLNPKPRNLVSGSFKFRSTPSGMMPTLSDLMRTIEQGIPGTSMPSFRLLSQNEKYALAMFIKSLRPDWESSENKILSFPSPPEDLFTKKTVLLASALRGHKLFQEACATCHGDKGLGDGPSAEGLVDAEDQPIRPANLSRTFIKSGPSAKDIFKAITTGLDGTPMPSFAEVYTEAQRWDLVAYVMFRRGQGAGLYSEDLDLNQKPSPAKISTIPRKKESL